MSETNIEHVFINDNNDGDNKAASKSDISLSGQKDNNDEQKLNYLIFLMHRKRFICIIHSMHTLCINWLHERRHTSF